MHWQQRDQRDDPEIRKSTQSMIPTACKLVEDAKSGQSGLLVLVMDRASGASPDSRAK